MDIPFVKYQGTGNDFILIDGREGIPELNVQHWCDRRFGIGADGLMIISNCTEADFEMIYYNSDGKLSSMCGNGGRCIAHWAHQLGIQKEFITFKAPDGFHSAYIKGNIVKLSMNAVREISQLSDMDTELNTGSPHYVRRVGSFPDNFIEEAKRIRHSDAYNASGINVNFYIENGSNQLTCRTFERGVEDETFSCGTGVTAVALTHANQNHIQEGTIQIQTLGGELNVHFKRLENGYFDSIFLEGPATFVFKGILSH